jgi:hypothetical protein
MTKLTIEALDSVGEQVVVVQLDPSLYGLELLSACSNKVAGVSVDHAQGALTVGGPDPRAYDVLRQFCSELLAAKLETL